jgi:hypothetical protein
VASFFAVKTKLQVFESKVLRKVFAPRKEQFRELYNEEPCATIHKSFRIARVVIALGLHGLGM